jgi:hypothetical protein
MRAASLAWMHTHCKYKYKRSSNGAWALGTPTNEESSSYDDRQSAANEMEILIMHAAGINRFAYVDIQAPATSMKTRTVNTIKQFPASEVNSRSAGQEIPCILREPKVRNLVYNSHKLVLIWASRIQPAPPPPLPNYFKIYFKIFDFTFSRRWLWSVWSSEL